MNAIDVERQAMKDLTGIGALTPGTRVFTAQNMSSDMLAAMFYLPDIGNTQALQDPTTGDLYAMYDLDSYGATYAP
jgi:hypothetical protein